MMLLLLLVRLKAAHGSHLVMVVVVLLLLRLLEVGVAAVRVLKSNMDYFSRLDKFDSHFF